MPTFDTPPSLLPVQGGLATPPGPRAPWYRRGTVWELAFFGTVVLGLMAGVARQTQHLKQYQEATEAVQVCENLAMVTAAKATRGAHPDWAFDARTTAVSRTERPDDRWWRSGTPSFQCAVVVSAGPGFIGMRIEGTPTVDMAYTVRFTGFPNPSSPLDTPNPTVVPGQRA